VLSLISNLEMVMILVVVVYLTNHPVDADGNTGEAVADNDEHNARRCHWRNT
jgi:hypothetical protein